MRPYFPHRLLTASLSLMLLVSTIALQPGKAFAQYEGTVVIAPDGSISPPTAPISTTDNITYKMTDNIVTSGDGIILLKENIILDGSGYSIEGPSNDSARARGVYSERRNNVTVKNIEITNFYIGILLWLSNNSRIMNNDVANNTAGIFIQFSYFCNISANTMTDNVDYCILNEGSDNSIFHNNLFGRALTDSSLNFWDDGYPSGGNYWSDYSGGDVYSGAYQNDTMPDWIGDTPYVIYQNSTDHYPLMHPYDPQKEEIEIGYRSLLQQTNALNETAQDQKKLLTTLLNQIGFLNSNSQESLLRLQEQITSMNTQLNNMMNFLYVLLILVAILVGTTIYFGLRKPKANV